jgi:hypothetical protein
LQEARTCSLAQLDLLERAARRNEASKLARLCEVIATAAGSRSRTKEDVQVLKQLISALMK